ncbi:MAG: proteasome accessory factor PafA2 family protein, partial [Acidimicrobiales bacterium]
MTKDSDFKDVIRARMAVTGERYTQALTHLLAEDSTARPTPRRIIGIERRYTVTAELRGHRRMQTDEAMRYVFRRVVSWGRSTNVYLENGARLYVLPEGTTAEYATPECDSARTATIHALAGDRRFDELVAAASSRLVDEGIDGEVSWLADTGPLGGQHESYTVGSVLDPRLLVAVLVPFLVTRQVYAGARGEIEVLAGRRAVLMPRADFVWHGIGGAGAGVMVDPSAAAHGDEQIAHRLHVAVGDVTHRPAVTFLTVGSTALLLRLLEEAPQEAPPSLALENPARAVREVSHDPSMRCEVRLADGRLAKPLRIQRVIFESVAAFAHRHGASNEERRVLAMWGHA